MINKVEMLKNLIKTTAEAIRVTITVARMNGIANNKEEIRVKTMIKQYQYVAFAI